MSYPNYPGYSQPSSGYPGYPPQPQNPGYPAAPGYPPAGQYPPQPGFAQGAYPSAQSAYPGAQPAYPAAQPAYPAAQPAYPASQSAYPSAPSTYPAAQPAYPAYPAPQPAYPAAQYGYPQAPPAAAGYSGYPQQAPQYPQQVPQYPQQPSHHQQHAPQQPHYAAQQQVPKADPNMATVTPVSPFDARADADALHKAMKGMGTDEKGLINVLCKRPSHQRVNIAQIYKASFGKDLTSKIKSETSGNFERLLVALCLPLADYLATEVHEAVKGLGTEEGSLIEILCCRTNYEMREMTAAYQRLYGRPIEKDIKGDTSGTLKMLLVSLCQAQRDENPVVDLKKADEDAKRLYAAGAGKFGTDESTFNSILVTRSWPHLRQLMHNYQAMTGKSLESAVKSEFSANAEKGLLAILKCAKSRPAYLAERLHNAIKGMGTKDRALIRIIVSRCDIDLANIKQEYQKMYNRALATDVAEDTSGDYKKGLLTLIG